MNSPGQSDDDVDHLLNFCRSASLISGYERREDEVTIATVAGRWIFPVHEAALFLHGTLRYRPDLLNALAAQKNLGRREKLVA